MATATEQRIIVETTTPGWFEVPGDSKRTRRRENDRVITAAEFRQLAGATAVPTLEQVEANKIKHAARSAKRIDAKSTKLTSGKMVTGKTVVIKCEWVDCGESREIKVQDRFQVRFCIKHQRSHRNELKRQKTAERRANRQAAKGR